MMSRTYIKLTCLLLCLMLLSPVFSGICLKVSAISDANAQYIESVGTAASEEMADSGVLASLTVSQAIFEAGWGTSVLAKKANNLFGMKAYSTYKGMVIDMTAIDSDGTVGIIYESYDAYKAANTASYVVSNRENVWRAYATRTESLADHNKLLTDSDRYSMIPGEYDYVAACWNIIEAGYASDMEYTKKIINCIEQYNLSRFDILNYPADQVIAVTKTRKHLPLNETYQLPVTIIQPFGAEDTLTYSSNNEAVATVDETGLITPIGYGECIITVTTSTGWHACCYIATYDPEETYSENTCTANINIYAEPSESSERYGYLSYRHCVISIGSAFVAEDGAKWIKVHSKAIVPSGMVELKTGYVKASGIKYVQTIKYDGLRDAETITLDQTEVSVPAYTSLKLTATVLAAEEATPSCTTIRWISDNPEVATVLNGKVKAIGEGECNIYAVSTDGIYASCKLTVTPGVYIPVESIAFDKTELNLFVGDSETLVAQILPVDATEPEIVWATTNPAVAQLKNGKVTAVGLGECEITATVNGLTATAKVTVTPWKFEGTTYKGFVYGNNVNLREGDSTSYPSMGRLYQGDTLDVYGELNGDWYFVEVTSGSCQGKIGYIYKDFVRFEVPPVESLVFLIENYNLISGDSVSLSWVVDPPESEMLFYTSDSSVVSVNANGVISALNAGTATVSVSSGDKVASVTVTVSENPFEGTRFHGVVATNGGNLNVRETPSASGLKLGSLPNGTPIMLYGESQDGWYRIHSDIPADAPLDGYVSAEWVKSVSPYVQQLVTEQNHIKSEPGTTYALKYNVSDNAPVTFTSLDESVATVDQNGVVTAVKEGVTQIKLTTADKEVLITVIVSGAETVVPPAPTEDKLIPSEGLTISDGYLWGLGEKVLPDQIKAMFDNTAEKLTVSADGEFVGSGTVISLTDGSGNVLDSVTVMVLGDCNGNGKIDASDYMMTRRIFLGTYTPTDIQLTAAKVFKGEDVTARDYMVIKRHFLGTYQIEF